MSHALDLFAGAGGWDLAADALGIHADGVELMPEARATRDAAGLSTIHDDVWTLDPAAPQGYDGLIASPPCQTFSAAGKGSGRKALDDVLYLLREGAYRDRDLLRSFGAELGDDRTALVLSPLHYATAYPFRWLAWEQVPSVLPVWQACAEVLRADGWHVWTGYTYSEQYGVPQTRKRAKLIASREHEVGLPAPTHSRYYSHDPARLDPGVRRWVSMAEGIGWGLLGRPSYTITGGSGHAAASGIEWGGKSTRDLLIDATSDPEVWRRKGWGMTDRPAPTVTGGGEPIAKLARYTDRPDWLPRYMSGAGSSSTVQRPRPITEPAHTITGVGSAEWHDRAEPAADQGQRARDAIRLEPHEAGILQSFPADHPWQGNKGKRYLQAGNAVPPGVGLAVLAEAIGMRQAAEGPRDLLDLLTEAAA